MNSLLSEQWDAIVIGAGPAGSLTALNVSKAGKRVLLVDKARFPRGKVCGCCLNQAGIAVLERAGLNDILHSAMAIPLKSLLLADGMSQAEIGLPGGFSISRETLDMELIERAKKAGVHFVDQVSARVIDVGTVQINGPGNDGIEAPTVHAKVIVVADGLNGHALDAMPQFAPVVALNARFGCGTNLATSNISDFYGAGRIYMACHESGYVGLVQLENGSLDMACALDRSFSRKHGSLAQAAAEILLRSKFPLPVSLEEMLSSQWHGTDSLTRKRALISDERIFVVGDSCGYPEPLTGEGMAWALESAEAVSPLVLAAVEQWHPSLAQRWQSSHAVLVDKRQLKSKFIAYSLRNNLARRLLLLGISTFPQLAQSIAARISQSRVAHTRIPTSQLLGSGRVACGVNEGCFE